jgi:hypothetical protein
VNNNCTRPNSPHIQELQSDSLMSEEIHGFDETSLAAFGTHAPTADDEFSVAVWQFVNKIAP